MAVVVATRIKPRKVRYLPRFLWGSLAAARQAERSPGLLTGRLRAEFRGVFWTLTVWQSGRDMATFRDSGVHLVLVPKLADWASEAVFGVWNTESEALPSWAEAARKIAEHPNFAPLECPSARHGEKEAIFKTRLAVDLPVRARG